MMKFRYDILNKHIDDDSEIKFIDIENIINELEFLSRSKICDKPVFRIAIVDKLDCIINHCVNNTIYKSYDEAAIECKKLEISNLLNLDRRYSVERIDDRDVSFIIHAMINNLK